VVDRPYGATSRLSAVDQQLAHPAENGVVGGQREAVMQGDVAPFEFWEEPACSSPVRQRRISAMSALVAAATASGSRSGYTANRELMISLGLG